MAQPEIMWKLLLRAAAHHTLLHDRYTLPDLDIGASPQELAAYCRCRSFKGNFGKRGAGFDLLAITFYLHC